MSEQQERRLVAAFLSVLQGDEWGAAVEFVEVSEAERGELLATLERTLERVRLLALPVKGNDDRRYTPYSINKRSRP